MLIIVFEMKVLIFLLDLCFNFFSLTFSVVKYLQYCVIQKFLRQVFPTINISIIKILIILGR